VSFSGHTAETKDRIAAAHLGKPKAAGHGAAIRKGQKLATANGGEMPHGTAGRYKGPLRCRCDECRTAWREYKRARRAASRRVR
jgi:hypothetical protein